MLASFLTSSSMISERVDGIWNRAIVAGVKPTQFLISHLIEGLVVMFVQSIETAIFVLVFLTPSLTLNAAVLICLIILLEGIAGVMFGIVLSIACDTVSNSMYSGMFFMNPATFTGGEFLSF